MDKYTKVRSESDEMATDDGSSSPNCLLLRVSSGGKIRRYVEQALAHFAGTADGAAVKVLGSGNAVTKAVSVAEIIRRQQAGVHQICTIFYSNVTDVWEPNDPSLGLDILRVKRSVPSISMLLSLAPLDPTTPGYQAPLTEEERTAAL
eukprot:m.44575 g.44575  ORF g.44575 m.44575 type:complete len:148 (-) comp12340_c0_seq1:146-589(-)